MRLRIVGQRLKTKVSLTVMEAVGHRELAARALAVEGVFIDIVVGLTTDE